MRSIVRCIRTVCLKTGVRGSVSSRGMEDLRVLVHWVFSWRKTNTGNTYLNNIIPLLDCFEDSNLSYFNSCRDIDECMYEQDPVCSQTCSNTVGSFQCGCMTGYVLRPDERSCKPSGISPSLLFSNRVGIRQVLQEYNHVTFFNFNIIIII